MNAGLSSEKKQTLMLNYWSNCNWREVLKKKKQLFGDFTLKIAIYRISVLLADKSTPLKIVWP